MPSEGKRDTLSLLTDPADMASWHPNHQSIRFDITLYHCTRAYERIFSNCRTAHDGAISAESCTFLNIGIAVFIFSRDRAAWVINVSEHHARPAKNIVLQCHIVIYRDIVLNFDVIPNDHLVPDEHILPQRAPRADFRARTHVDEMPNAGPLTDDGALIYNRRSVRGVVHIEINPRLKKGKDALHY